MAIRVLIIDDSIFIRKLFVEMLSNDPEIEVVGEAVDPHDARAKIKLLNPDVVTLDIEMPKMDGITFLEKIMTLRPLPVIMVSTLTQKNSDIAVRALEMGAIDYIAKPIAGGKEAIIELQDDLITKIKYAAKSNVKRIINKSLSPTILHLNKVSKIKLIAFGSSTGGVEALRETLVKLPENMPPIVITQHMPKNFTQSFANRLNGICKLKVEEAQDNMSILPGHVYIAPGGDLHLEVGRFGGGLVCRLVNRDPVSGHRPSVDVLFSSIAKNLKEEAIGVILTGMGSDGASGLLEMFNSGAHTIGQDKASSVVYGMPRVAFENGSVVTQLSLDKIADNIINFLNK